jgi:exopolyphosphatase / guanosine-5'-triphosphate,3'-diphosphate pyrophosphatase
MPQRIAACDVGSNTVHLLVAEPLDGGVREVRRVVSMPRVGAVVNATGRIGVTKTEEVCRALQGLSRTAQAERADVLLLAATEAVRRAADRAEAVARFGEAFGAPCALLSGDSEARLSFRGAVAMSHTGQGTALVCDIGGGSTEFAVGGRDHLDVVASLPIGSGAATDRWLPDDPPTDAQRRACYAGVVEALRSAPPARPDLAIATGGTATSLPRLLGRHHESHLYADDLARCRELLSARPSGEIALAHDLDPARARVLAGGVEIVDAILAVYALERIRVTIHGLRTGMILAYVEKRDRWPEG